MLKKQHPEVQGPVDDYQKLSLNKRWRMIADYREKERRDARAALAYARDEGLAEGRAESQQVIAESQQALAESQQVIAEGRKVIEEKDRENEELRRKLREAGIDG
jgi:hypothetical protein